MDNLNHLVLKMAVRLMEIKIQELDAQIAKVSQLSMSMGPVTKLQAERKKIADRIPLIRDAIMNNDQDQMQSDCTMLFELDLF